MRPTRTDHLHEWQKWAKEHQGARDPRLEQVLDLVLARFELDRLQYSEIFEPSCSWNAAGWQVLRFSYGLPSFCKEPGPVNEFIAKSAEPFATNWAHWLKRVLRLARHKAVAHPIIGLAYADPEHWRWKLYLQFQPDQPLAALDIVRTLVGCPDLRRRFAGAPLHLVGFDLGAAGLTQVKLYALHHQLRLRDVPIRFGPVAMLQDLWKSGVDQLQDVLSISRLQQPDDPALATTREFDFALADNNLDWATIAGLPCMNVLNLAQSPLSTAADRWPLTVRRISVPVGAFDKFNAYYVLTAMEPA